MSEYKYAALRTEILKKYHTYGNFADRIRKKRQVVSSKLNGKVGFTKADIVEWCQALDIPIERNGFYFF